MISRTLLLAGIFTVVAATSLHAHSVWIEPVEGKLVVRFAEPDGRLEKSPGHLDSLSLPIAFTLFTNAPLSVEAPKKSDHFLLVNASQTNAAFVETSFTVRAARKPYFYARWQPNGLSASEPMLTLDLVPTGKPGEVRVYLRGKPHGNIKATLRTPDDKEKELSVDADGFVRFESRQSGQHLLTVAHQRDPIPGFHLGRNYKETSHNAALTWQQP
jgi:hypothetical protein